MKDLSTPLSKPERWTFVYVYGEEKVDSWSMTDRSFFSARQRAAIDLAIDPDCLVLVRSPFMKGGVK